MSAPFRELFVEVPEVLIDILRAAVNAKLPSEPPHLPYRRPSATAMFVEAMHLEPVVRALCERYGLEQLITQRSARDRTIEIVGVRSCRYLDHIVRVDIPDNALEDARDRHELVLKHLDRATRNPCFCVAPPRGRQ
jgi:hypothetical protein